jgi:hypothetical protein
MALLKRLKKNRLARFDDLRRLANRTIRGADPLFLPALSFLYILGLVEYRPKTDAIEYVGP